MRKTWQKGKVFEDCKPRSADGLSAEHRFNAAIINGHADESALREMVERHQQTYPKGIDAKHTR